MVAPHHNAAITLNAAAEDNVSGSHPQRRIVHIGLMAECLAIGCARLPDAAQG
ncbi:hypothetical protein B7R78_0015215 [Ralstonia solanacearum]|uniref:hypothetical protein n=1 Tax=Ralstonia solanacearum species complex TaxID=3116862 RepID=UPI00025016A1|nr:hypothetical protein [Ralstonia solanacearum]MBT1538408.1 hypothetical protein [Ralstonia solanacearum]CCF95716.1 conserved hypothetical protein [Ralstonia solanacearum K60]